VLRRLLDFFIFSKIYVAIPVTCLSAVSFKLFGSSVDWSVLGFTYLSTLGLYAFHQVWGLNSLGLDQIFLRQKWAIANKSTLVWVAAVAGFIAAGCAFILPVKSFFLLIPFGIISVGYSAPIFLKKRLRDIPSIKIFLISIVVAGVVVVLPGIQVEADYTELAGLFTIQSLFIFGITIPFDIRDMKVDKTKLKTIPILFGERKAKQLATGSIWLSSLMAWHTLNSWVPFITTGIVASIVVWFADSKRNEYYYSLLVEGTMIVQFVAVYWLM
jgi:hypothetical protein